MQHLGRFRSSSALWAAVQFIYLAIFSARTAGALFLPTAALIALFPAATSAADFEGDISCFGGNFRVVRSDFSTREVFALGDRSLVWTPWCKNGRFAIGDRNRYDCKSSFREIYYVVPLDFSSNPKRFQELTDKSINPFHGFDSEVLKWDTQAGEWAVYDDSTRILKALQDARKAGLSGEVVIGISSIVSIHFGERFFETRWEVTGVELKGEVSEAAKSLLSGPYASDYFREPC